MVWRMTQSKRKRPMGRRRAAGGEFVQGYNTQTSVAQDSHLVVGNHVSQATNDKQEIEPALNELAKVEAELGKPEVLVADAGYHSKENVERCVEQGIEPYIAGSREHHNQPLEQRLQAPPECPADAVTAMKHRFTDGRVMGHQRDRTEQERVPEAALVSIPGI